MPIRAKRLMYYDDTAYQELYESQDFNAPLPIPPHAITEADYKYVETTEDLAAQRDEAEKAKADAQARAAEKRDVADGEGGQGAPSEKNAPAAEHADHEEASAPQDPPSAEAEPAAPLAAASDLQKKAASATEDANGQQTFDLPNTGAIKSNPPAPLAPPSDLQKKAARLRRRGKERQNALPLPEVSGSLVQVSVEDAAAARLSIDGMALKIAEAKARAV